MEININGLRKCPIFNKVWEEIMSRDWNKVSKEMDKIADSLEYFTVEYNTDTSAQHLSSKEYGDEIV